MREYQNKGIGTIEKISLQKGITIGKKSPFIIFNTIIIYTIIKFIITKVACYGINQIYVMVIRLIFLLMTMANQHSNYNTIMKLWGLLSKI
jgi:putative effector of murein hydrolase